MQFEALVIADREVRRMTAEISDEPALLRLERSLEIAKTVEGPWDVVINGDLLNQLEAAARKSLSGRRGLLWQAWMAVFGGVRGIGLPALVRELELVANRAATVRTDNLFTGLPSTGSFTGFVFKDKTLADALANRLAGRRRLTDRRESDGLIAVLANPGYDLRWRRRN